MRNKLFINYILLQLLFFVLMGTFCGYGTNLLLSYGFSTSLTGIIMSIGCIASAIIQPVAADISDNSKKISLFNICTYISIIVLACCTLMYFQNEANVLVAVLFVALNGFYYTYEPLLNSIPIILENNGYKVNYGIGRACGSFGYALATGLLGMLTAKLPYKIILVVAIIDSILLLIISLLSTKDFNKIQTNIEKKEEETISYSQFLKRHKHFLLLMILTAGIFFGYTMSDNMMYLVVTSVGGTSKQQGLIMSFKAMLEIPVIFFFDKIEKRFGAKTLLKVAAVSFTIKALLYYLASDIKLIWIAQLTQLTALSFEIPAIVSYINQIMDKKEVVRGQALYIMGVTVASVLSGFMSGILVEYFSTKTMLLICLISTAVSALFFVIEINKSE